MIALTLLTLTSFLVTSALTPFVWTLAQKWGAVDRPDSVRKKQIHSMPLGGGISLFLGIVFVIGTGLLTTNVLTSGGVTLTTYTGIAIGALLLLLGGWLDDTRQLPPYWQFLFPVLASVVAIQSGLNISQMTNPFGGVWEPGWFSPILVFLWLMGTMYTTKLLDGLDGLVSGIGTVGAFLVAALAGSVAFFQPDIRALALVVAGASLGFLWWNRPPASGYLGEGGSLLIGYLLGVLAVLSGSKIATLLLVLGVPMLDVVWVIAWRMREGQPVWKGDRKHLHHRLVDTGWSPLQVWLFYLATALSLGILALTIPSPWKYAMLPVLAVSVPIFLAHAKMGIARE